MLKVSEESKKRLFKSVLALKTEEECAAFFDDVLTIQELESISQRVDVANELLKGKNYQEVQELTGASTGTISRVSKCINYGGGGYKTVLDRIKK